MREADSELLKRLTDLASDNKSLRTALEAAQRLIEHRHSLDEVIEHALKDALALRKEAEEAKDRGLEGEGESQRQAVIASQTEALTQIVEQDVKALAGRLERLSSSLQLALSLLQEVQELGAQLEGRLVSVVERLEGLGAAGVSGEEAAPPSAPAGPPARPKVAEARTLEPRAEVRPAERETRREPEIAPPIPMPKEEKIAVAAELAGPRTTTLVVVGFQDISALRSFERAIGQVSGVVRVEPRRFSRGTLELAVVHRGELALGELAIPGFGLMPTRIAEGYREFQLTPQKEPSGAGGHDTAV